MRKMTIEVERHKIKTCL